MMKNLIKNVDEKMNNVSKRLKLREPSLRFLNWGFGHKKSLWFGRLMEIRFWMTG